MTQTADWVQVCDSLSLFDILYNFELLWVKAEPPCDVNRLVITKTKQQLENQYVFEAFEESSNLL